MTQQRISALDELNAGMQAAVRAARGRRSARPSPTPVEPEPSRVAVLGAGRVVPGGTPSAPWWYLTALPPDVAGVWCCLGATAIAAVALIFLPWPGGVLRGLAVAVVALALGFGLLHAAGVALLPQRRPAVPERRR